MVHWDFSNKARQEHRVMGHCSVPPIRLEVPKAGSFCSLLWSQVLVQSLTKARAQYVFVE
jgi:hypothetical protein